MSRKRDWMMLYISIGSFFLMSVSFLLMPIDFAAKKMPEGNVLVGVMFWATLILGIVTQIILGYTRKNWFVRNRIRRSHVKSKVGVIVFLRNAPACVADGLFAVSLIALIISIVVTNATGYACYVFMALTVFSFCLHCVFNGKVYYFLTNQETLLKASQPKHLDEDEGSKEDV